MGTNVWGNCGMRVARRHEPKVTGLMIATFGGTCWVATAEDGKPLWETNKNWVGVGSPAHTDALDREAR